MKKRMYKHSEQLNGSKIREAMWLGTPVSLVFETETSCPKHHNAAAAYPAQIVPARRKSRIMKFLRSL